MKKTFILFIILLSLHIPLYPSAEEQSERVLIVFKDSIEIELLQEKGSDIHHLFEDLKAVSVTLPSSTIKTLQNHERIKYIEPDYEVVTSEQLQGWGYQNVLASEANTNGWTGKGVKIGILDTGIRSNHPDLIISGGVSFVGDRASYEDDEGHGTHVAGIIGALDNEIGIVGIAPEASLYAIKVLNNTGLGNLSDVVAGIEWAIDHKLDVINLSLTAEQGSEFLEKALTRAYEAGILIIAASGNSQTTLSPNTDVLYPARYESVIAVGSVGIELLKSKFSYFGPSLEFVAPGEKIYSTYHTPDYEYGNGTSMAAPYVTGMVALYKQAYPELTPQEIRKLMQKGAKDLGEPGWDSSYGYGLVQAPTTERVFSDVATDQWYADEVHYLYEKGIVTGYENKRYLPDDLVTRAEAITMIGRTLEYEGKLQPTRYPDVGPEHFASGYVEHASEEGIITGYPNGYFQPEASIIRADVAVMLQRAYQFSKTSTAGTVNFLDIQNNKYYSEPVSSLLNNHITEGYPDQTFRPFNSITRAEFAVFLARVLDESFR